MPKITNFAFCDQDYANDEGLVKVIDLIEVRSNDFSLALVLSITDYSIKEDHFCEIIIKDSTKSILFQTESFPVENDTPGEVDSNELITGFTLGVQFNKLTFRGPGLYSVQVKFDGESLGEFYVPVTFRGGSE